MYALRRVAGVAVAATLSAVVPQLVHAAAPPQQQAALLKASQIQAQHLHRSHGRRMTHHASIAKPSAASTVAATPPTGKNADKRKDEKKLA